MVGRGASRTEVRSIRVCCAAPRPLPVGERQPLRFDSKPPIRWSLTISGLKFSPWPGTSGGRSMPLCGMAGSTQRSSFQSRSRHGVELLSFHQLYQRTLGRLRVDEHLVAGLFTPDELHSISP